MRLASALMVTTLMLVCGSAVADEVCRVWQDRTHEVAFPRTSGEIVYDSWRDVIVFVGWEVTGWYGSPTYRTETWEWDGKSWTPRLEPGPTARSGFSLAFDENRGVTVLFGGNVPLTDDQLGDTWEWDGEEWHLISDSGPAPRSGCAMTYDSANARTILAGGWQYGKTFYDMWAYDGSGWQPLSTETPAAGGVLAYDTSRSVLMLFEGAQLWEFDGKQWVKRAANPAGSPCDSVAYDAQRQRTVCFSRDATVFEWDGSTWHTVSLSRGSTELLYYAGVELTYDKVRKAIIAYCNPGIVFEAGLWEIGPSSEWRLIASTGPSSRFLHAMAYDAVRGEVVMFGGRPTYLWDTWTWDGAAWHLASLDGPSPRQSPEMAFDSHRGVVVLFGGRGYEWPDNTAHCCSLGGTWEWDGQAWAFRDVPSPGERADHAMAFDEAREITLLFGGFFQSESGSENHAWGDTWTWDGATWTELPVDGPSPRYDHAMAYDSVRQVAVLYGGVNYESDEPIRNSETWEWDGAEWSIRAAVGPEVRWGARMFFDPAREVVVLVGVPEAGGYGRHWEWDGVKWRNMGAVADVRRTYFAVAYDHARQTVVVHGGIQNGTYVADTVEAELGFVSADCDADCDADLLDFAVLQTCAGDMSADAACAQLDVDGSGWVDAADFAELFAMPTGPSEPLD